MLRCALALLVVAGCGRLGFDAVRGDGGDNGPSDVSPGDGMPPDDAAIDGPPQMIACADMNLGSALGPSVATGSIDNAGNQYSSCSGDGNDLTFGWFAPATATYRIDLCGSDANWDSVLSIRNGSCTGASLACDDDSCGGGGGLQGRVTVNLTAGQGIVIIVDSLFPQNGNYQLAITQM